MRLPRILLLSLLTWTAAAGGDNRQRRPPHDLDRDVASAFGQWQTRPPQTPTYADSDEEDVLHWHRPSEPDKSTPLSRERSLSFSDYLRETAARASEQHKPGQGPSSQSSHQSGLPPPQPHLSQAAPRPGVGKGIDKQTQTSVSLMTMRRDGD